MASKFPTFTEISRDFLSCSICLEPYENPKQLPCLHTLCLKCLDEHIQKSAQNGKIKCPLCQKEIPIPQGGAHSFSDNYFVASLCEVIPPEDNNKIFCDICEGHQVEAVAVCKQCVDRLCQTCKDCHQRTKYTKDHQVLSIAQYQSGEYLNELRSHQKSFCPKHNEEELKLYCNDCQIPVCILCTKLHHDHHKMAALSDAAKTLDQCLADVMEQIQPKTKILTSAIEIQKETLANIEINSEQITNDIETWATEMHAKVDDMKVQLTKDITGMARKATKEHEGILDGLQHHLAATENTISYVHRIIKFGRDAEKLQLYTSIKQTFDELQRQPVDIKSTETKFHFKSTQITQDFAKVEMKEKSLNKQLADTIFPAPRVLQKAQLAHSFNSESGCSWDRGIAVNNNDQILATCSNKDAVHVYNKQGQLQFTFGNKGKDKLITPYDVTTDAAGDIYVTNGALNEYKIHIYDQEYKLKEVIKTKSTSTNGYAHVAINSKGDIILGDFCSKTIKTLDYGGQIKETIDKNTIGVNQFKPHYVTTNDKDEIILSESSSSTVYILNPHGQKLHQYKPSGNLALLNPYGVRADKWGHIIVADPNSHTLHLVSSTGKHLGLLGTKDDGLHQPMAVAISGPGEVVVVQTDGQVKFYKYLDI